MQMYVLIIAMRVAYDLACTVQHCRVYEGSYRLVYPPTQRPSEYIHGSMRSFNVDIDCATHSHTLLL